ncbi:His Kinase A (phospho-acceptor) domain-containing protein [Lachnospiraceae bacterium G11]|nr:His Kinase A (phospho-acceptor) domain-containing protein [Lachnospiraceae bacterium G11]
MRNYYRFVAFLAILFILGIAAFTLWGKYGIKGYTRNDEITVQLNEIKTDAEEAWDNLDNLRERDYEADYLILDMQNQILLMNAKSSGEYEDFTLERAIKEGYPYAYAMIDNKVVGSVILLTDPVGSYAKARSTIIIGVSILGLIFIGGALVFGKYVENRLVNPFERMKEFAGLVAEGKLDEPLMMDRSNIFGAFTESFDIMREELAESRKREVALQKKEKELVASLSHDLKTPITGIKLTTELLQAKLMRDGETKGDNGEILEKLGNISSKAEQIDALVGDLFASTLDDLGEFKVSLKDEESLVIGDIVRKYDDRGLVSAGEIPKTLINVDTKRLGQVIGNIISNSYKYAETKIDITYDILEEFLEMRIRDYGPGVPEDEMSLIANKFYRGKKWAESKEEGSGLGLYIAKTLMEKMKGEMLPANTEDGFCITLLIPLS